LNFNEVDINLAFPVLDIIDAFKVRLFLNDGSIFDSICVAAIDPACGVGELTGEALSSFCRS
jgi:hypothetical protein